MDEKKLQQARNLFNKIKNDLDFNFMLFNFGLSILLFIFIFKIVMGYK